MHVRIQAGLSTHKSSNVPMNKLNWTALSLLDQKIETMQCCIVHTDIVQLEDGEAGCTFCIAILVAPFKQCYYRGKLAC
jgi:hypothetical protein